MIVIGQGVVEWVAKRTNEFGNFGAAQGIGWLREGKIIAGTVYADWNGPNVMGHIASDGSKTWLTREFLAVMFDYPFVQLKVNRITATIGSGNVASRRFVAHLGFGLETTLKGAHPSGDLLVYRLWRQDCRFLREPYVSYIKPRTAVVRAAA